MNDLPDLKKLDKIIALCRKRGVSTIEIGGVKLTLGEAPVKHTKVQSKAQGEPQSDSQVETDILSEEEMLFWSTSGGIPVQAS